MRVFLTGGTGYVGSAVLGARAPGWTPTLHSVAGNVARLFEKWKRGKAAA